SVQPLSHLMFFLVVWHQVRLVYSTPHHSSSSVERIFLFNTLTAWTHISISGAFLILLRHPIAQTITSWYRNINLLSIAYAVRPQLRTRLTLIRRTFLRKPLAFGERDSHSFFVTHTGILTSTRATSPHSPASLHVERSPTIIPKEYSTVSVIRLAPVQFRRRATRPLSSDALL